MDAFSHVIEAVIVSGVVELTSLTDSKLPRSELKQGVGPLLIIFEACKNLILHPQDHLGRYPFLLQVGRKGEHGKRLWYFFKSWGKTEDQKWLREARNKPLFELLHLAKHHSRLALEVT